MIDLYSVLHEADPSKAISVFNDIMNNSGESNDARLRKNKGLSQSQLVKAANISVRSIQLYEQRQIDINNAQHNLLTSLSKALGCTIDDLI